MLNHSASKSRKEIQMKYNYFKIMLNTGHNMYGIKGELGSHMSTPKHKNQKIHLTLQLPIFQSLNQTNTKTRI